MHNNEKEVGIFGIVDYDEYWKSRKTRNRTYKTEIHHILVDLVKKYTVHGNKVLDLGVGPGHVFKELMSEFDMYGVEFADEAFALYDFDASKIIKHDLQNGIPNLPALPFSTIIASHIVHHMRNPISFIKQSQQNLKENGIFILATQNISFIPYRLKYFFFGEFPKVSPGHVNFISPYEYKKILTNLGFDIIEIKTTGRHTFLNYFFPFLFSLILFF